jgi:hypothetical protein
MGIFPDNLIQKIQFMQSFLRADRVLGKLEQSHGNLAKGNRVSLKAVVKMIPVRPILALGLALLIPNA